jgi:hypothetical protein
MTQSLKCLNKDLAMSVDFQILVGKVTPLSIARTLLAIADAILGGQRVEDFATISLVNVDEDKVPTTGDIGHG